MIFFQPATFYVRSQIMWTWFAPRNMEKAEDELKRQQRRKDDGMRYH